MIGHLFGLYNLNQLADALEIPKSGLYEHLSEFSLYQWKRMLLVIGCTAAVERIQQTESMSAATQSRRRITISVDDTVQQRNGKVLSYCYHWYSGRFHTTLNGQNVLAVTIKIGDHIIPLGVRLVSKQGRANTQKPQILMDMMHQIQAFFNKHDIDTDISTDAPDVRNSQQSRALGDENAQESAPTETSAPTTPTPSGERSTRWLQPD